MRTEEASCLKNKMKGFYLILPQILIEFSSNAINDMFKGKLMNFIRKRHIKKKNYFNKSKIQIQKSKDPFFVYCKLSHNASHR